MSRSARVALLALAAARGLATAAPSPAAEADLVGGDDECASGAAGDCALSALQMRGARVAHREVEDPGLGGGYEIDAPEGWIEADKNWPGDIRAKPEEDGSAEEARVAEGDADKFPGTESQIGTLMSCASNPETPYCYLYRACCNKGHRYCTMAGYLVMPGNPISGTESINRHNARSYDYLWNVALGRCGGKHCVIIVNPQAARSQEQLHIHFRHYNHHGHKMKKKLQQAVCNAEGWVDFSSGSCASGSPDSQARPLRFEVGVGKAKLFQGMPRVFSEAASIYGSLAGVGIEVWPSSCGGRGYIIQAQRHCSFEHQITKSH